MADDESRGVHLSDKQLVFVFMAGTVAAVVVFLFGVLVGRGVQRARGPVADGDPAAVQVVPDSVPGDPPVGDSAPRQGGGAPGLDDLSYPARLGRTPPAERLKPAPPPAGDSRRETAPPEIPAEPVAQAPPSAAGSAAPSPERSADAPYTVQVTAVKRRDEADAIVKRLKAKGYDAYVFVPDGADSLGVFRVRIGSYKDKHRADMIAERLLREDKRYKPWVTR